jgi:hypothetical protein
MGLHLEPAVTQLIERTTALWFKHWPVFASLWGMPIEQATEDLSDAGLAAWNDALASIESSIQATRQHTSSIVDSIAISELERWLVEERYRHSIQSIYRTRATPYLRLCAFALLPPFLRSDVVDSSRHDPADVEQRLRSCLAWLETAERRIDAGQIVVSVRDCRLSEYLSRVIGRWSAEASPVALTLADRLDKWSGFKSRTAGDPMRVRLAWYVENVIGWRQFDGDTAESVMARLEREVAALIDVLQETPWQGTPQSLDGLDDACVEWIDDLGAELRRQIAVCDLLHASAPARIGLMPTLIEPFARHAIYLPTCMDDGWGKREAMLLIGRSYPRELRRLLAVTLAHELCPGHHEQLSRAASSPLASLTTLTRSPLGLEGWACNAERLLLRLPEVVVGVKATTHFQCIGRLIASVRILGLVLPRLRDTLERRLASSLGRLSIEQQRALEATRSESEFEDPKILAYTLGLLDTESSLARVAHVLGSAPDSHETIDAFLRWGPIRPSSIADLVEHATSGSTPRGADGTTIKLAVREVQSV